MSILAVQAAITQLVQATRDGIGAGAPTLFFNNENVPEGQAAPWMRATILWGGAKTETGGTGTTGNLNVGVLHLAFFDLPDAGDGTLIGLIDVFRPAFSRVKVGGAQFYAPSGPVPVTGDPAWSQLVVTCPFDYRE